MKCKPAVPIAAAPRDARLTLAGNSLRERVGELGRKAFGKFALVDAIAVRQHAGGHVEGAEYQVEHRESGGKVLLAAAVGRGVVPAVEHRPGDDISERPERPVEI